MVVDERPVAPHPDRVLHALADATRRDIVAAVLGTEHSVSALARRYPMSFAAVQKHVAVLESAQLVRKRRRGREQLVSGNIDAIHAARALLDDMEELWRQRVARMHDVLDTAADRNVHNNHDNERPSDHGPY
jgi:DNA-binding transcriptional ArsR family regulator